MSYNTTMTNLKENYKTENPREKVFTRTSNRRGTGTGVRKYRFFRLKSTNLNKPPTRVI